MLEYKETEKKVIGSLGLESFSISDFTADYQLFVLAFKDSGFDNLNSDGFLGLGFNLLSEYNPTFIENLKNQGAIRRSIFSLYLSNINYNNHIKSSFIIGGHDSEAYGTGDMHTIDINSGYGF